MIRYSLTAALLTICGAVLLGCADSLTTSDSAEILHLPNAAELSGEGKDLAPEPQSVIATMDKRKVVSGNRFMAVTANPHATLAAYRILADGGTAIDAAVAAQMVLGLVEPQSSGLGGGGFLVYWDVVTKTLNTYDGRETAPIAADESLFLNADAKTPLWFFDAVIGGRSVGVPGLVQMLEKAHGRHGINSWGSLFDDAIGLAENGFAVSDRLHTLIKLVPKVNERPDIAGYLFDEKGQPLSEGTLLRNPQYAGTLKQLAADGGGVFYRGNIARSILDAVNSDKNPGYLTQADFDDYEVKERDAVCKQLFGYRICGMGPPSSGGSTVISILGVLESLDKDTNNKTGMHKSIANDTELAHRFIEASRLAFADRDTYVADPDFIDVPLDALLSQAYLNERAQLINANSAIDKVRPGSAEQLGRTGYLTQASPEMMSTTHISIVDRYGSVLSMTTSIETAFGSRLMVDGFILNNQLTDFSFSPLDGDKNKVANRVQGGKRPRSSMSPMIVFDEAGLPVMVIGSPGGKKIIGYVARVLYEVLVLDIPVQDAVAGSHVIHLGKQLELERGVSNILMDGLKAKGHQPKTKPQTSGIHVIIRQDDRWVGVADPRREGIAMGQ